MSAVELGLLLLAALAAGSINGAVGSGSLVTLPVLLAFGLDPAAAVTTNTIAMVTSALGGTLAYRKELREDREHIRGLRYISVAGGVIGSVLLLTTSADALDVIVPILIGFALVLVIVQPRLADLARSRAGRRAGDNPFGSNGLRLSILGCSVYGGYFAAAQGILLLGALGAFSGRPLRTTNGIKNLLTLTVNVTAATGFTIAYFTGHADVEWLAVAVMAVGATIGGYTGGRLAKAVPDWALRALIIVIAVVSLAHELIG
ncbi:sulfite exporter TauE/SafE family protein [Jiangella asiatica]|uniref:Probable membrane transporter protein n=1 Tax=Jiangella asiatica TaxID=2530372 RepID=A0A4R5DXM6_9ACTN|nr:sulfite exporter TauE/SafE family protein [Jiangella asiatica]TDE15863.1 sulfite exporter TauE/SafE family protein [Jiangella asiatica]